MSSLPSETLTFLFTDVEGSTRLWQQHPALMPDIIARHDRLLREAVEAHGGRVFRTVGDAVYAVFRSPADALSAALEGQRALLQEPWDGGISLRVRMGLHTGVVGVRDGEFVGHTLNRVARLMASGHGGQILLSNATASLLLDALPPGTALLDLGEHRLKDLERPEHIYQVKAPDLPAGFPPLHSLDTLPGNLPVQSTSFVGREREVESVVSMLRNPDTRLLTLLGPGGTGKTRLALQVGAALQAEYQDGVFFVPLAPVRDTFQVAPAIASALGIPGPADTSLDERLAEHLRTRAMLLILDNFEQVLDAAQLVALLLSASSQLRVIVTSRAVLHLSAEHQYAVPPLQLPDLAHLPDIDTLARIDAVALFIQRARAIKPDFALTPATAAAVAAICARLDGLPLAIELAAARIKLFPPGALLARLNRSLTVLTGGARDLPARQQTLRGAIDWSYSLLSADEQRLFARLSVFAGGCTFDATEQVCNPEGQLDLLECLASLVDKSLVRQEGEEEPRFSMLETIREYALERLAYRGERDTLQRRHADYFLALAGEVADDTAQDGPARVKPEYDNLRVALSFVIDHELAPDAPPQERVAFALRTAKVAQQIYAHDEAVALLRKAQGMVDDLPQGEDRDACELDIQTALAVSSVVREGSYLSPDALTAFRRAQIIGDRLGRPNLPPVLGGLALAALSQGRTLEAEAMSRQLLEAAARDSTPMLQAEACYMLGVTSFWLGRLRQSQRYLAQALAQYKPEEHWTHQLLYPWDPGVACAVRLALTHWHLGYPEQARRQYRDGLALAERLAHPFSLAYALVFGFWLFVDLDELQAAEDAAQRLAEVSAEHNIGLYARVVGVNLGYCRVRRGEIENGIAEMDASITVVEEAREYVHVPFSLGLHADALFRVGRTTEALETVDRGLAQAERAEQRFWDAEFYRLRAELLMVQGDTKRARAALDRAAEIAAKQDALALALRVATSRYKLERQGPDEKAARDGLAAVYGRFTEGFDTEDLRAAHQLLTESAIS
jgi:predicted ATPase/class 3 adenylate cyclase